MRPILIALLMCLLVFLIGAISTTKKNGDWLWQDDNLTDRDVTVHVTVPAGVTATVTPYKNGTAGTGQTGAGSDIDVTLNDCDQIKITYSGTTAKLSCQYCLVNSSTETASTWNATSSNVVLWGRSALTQVNFHVDVDDPNDTATVQAFNGGTVVGEWTVTIDDPLDVTTETTAIKVLSGSGTGGFEYSTGGG